MEPIQPLSSLVKTQVSSLQPKQPTIKTPESPEPSHDELVAASTKIQKFIQQSTDALTFAIDKDHHNALVIKVTDTKTGDLIKQIPSKEALEIASALTKLQGLLVQEKV